MNWKVARFTYRVLPIRTWRGSITLGRDGTYSVKTGKHTSYGWLSFKDAVGRLSELLEMTEEQVQSMMDNFEGDSK